MESFYRFTNSISSSLLLLLNNNKFASKIQLFSSFPFSPGGEAPHIANFNLLRVKVAAHDKQDDRKYGSDNVGAGADEHREDNRIQRWSEDVTVDLLPAIFVT